MKLKIEVEVPDADAKKTFAVIRNALAQKEAAELMDAFTAGDHFSMNEDKAAIKITLTKL